MVVFTLDVCILKDGVVKFFKKVDVMCEWTFNYSCHVVISGKAEVLFPLLLWLSTDISSVAFLLYVT